MNRIYCYPLNMPKVAETKTPKLGAKDRKEKKKMKEKEKKMKEKKLVNDNNKKVENHITPRADLPDQVAIAKKHYKLYCYNCHEGCIPKIWRAAPRDCSSTQQSPYWLVLPHQEMINRTKPFIGVPGASIQLEFDAASRLGFTLHGGRSIEYQWVEEDCIPVGPYSSSDEQFRFTNAIAFEEKFYVLSLQGILAVIDVDLDPQQKLRAKISIIPGVKRAIPPNSSKGFREYLLQSNGELLLVLLVSRRSMNVVDDIEVFRLDLTREKGWIKIESLGDQILIVEHKCCRVFSPTPSRSVPKIKGLSARQSGIECPRNCIYFTHQPGTEWWVFDVGSRSTSPA